jgi:hypothetical protein
MTDVSPSTQSPGHPTERMRAQAIAALVPFFVGGRTCDEMAARVAAESMLDDYMAVTPKELQLSTQIIALGWASLACLSAATVVKDASLDEMLRLQDAALALHRSSQKATKALEARRKERTRNPRAVTPENARWDEGAFQLAINQAMEKMNDANARLASFMAASALGGQTPRLSFVTSEPMTPAVLARRRRRDGAAAKNA